MASFMVNASKAEQRQTGSPGGDFVARDG